MLFNTWEFAVFMPCVLACYYILAPRPQNVLLLLSSYFFYSCWDWRFTGLLLLSTIVDYTVARFMPRASPAKRRFLLLISICTNLGILGFFKYFNFLLDSTVQLLEQLGLGANLFFLEIILPVGISFYTFQTMAYTIDVFRGRIEPEKNIVVFGIYVAYFPQLVAGPIERAQHLLPQIRARRTVSSDQIASGLVLIVIGLLRKVVIADNAATYVDLVFSDPTEVGWQGLAKGVLYFSLQIYGDFAGYSNIARGCSRLLGIELMQNFDIPYFATSITIFWRKWHISLSSWLRDYLYIPLGGNRGSAIFAYRNLMLTMLLGGLWHGAGWNFIIWGGIHGVALGVHKWWLGDRKPANARMTDFRSLAGALIGWAVTMAVVGFAWVFFRAPSCSIALDIVKRICTFADGSLWIPTTPLIGMLTLLLAIDIPQSISGNQVVWLRWPWYVRGIVYALAILLLVLWGSGEDVPFIYFQF